jgi:GrpB-like predicted nucleotidyltransferase (UPF0157 family)
VTEPVIVVDYDPAWPQIFEDLRHRVASVLGILAITIEHVGSTSIPLTAAKPIIDMDVLVSTSTDVVIAIERLADLGYLHIGDLGITDREAFRGPPEMPRHNLYVCPLHSREYGRHIAFRNYLRAHPDESQAYSELKKTLAVQFRDDRDAYTEAKTDFVNRILNLAP